MKGVSTIIASILLVVITIGLISTAYLYFAGIVTVGPVVAIASAYCDASDMIHVTIRNDGTSAFNASTITWLNNGVSVSPSPTCAPAGNVNAGSTTTCNFTGTANTVNNFVAIGPKNQAGGPITC